MKNMKIGKTDICNVEVDHVIRVYSGKPGCGCGCRGTYYDTSQMKKRILRKLQTHSDQVGMTVGHDELIYYFETETRYNWVYVNPMFKILKERD